MGNHKSKQARKETARELRNTVYEKLFMTLSVYRDQVDENALVVIVKKASKSIAKELSGAIADQAKATKKQKKSKKKLKEILM